jgi:hypothetical protein
MPEMTEHRATLWRRARSAAAAVLGRTRPFTVILVASVTVYAVLLVFFPAVFSRGPLRSHFHYDNKHLFDGRFLQQLALLAAVFAGLVAAVRCSGRRFRTVLLLLFVLSVAMQWTFSLLEGLNGRRMSATLLDPRYGHSEFVAIACADNSPLETARSYEELCRTDPRFVFCKSKPPGQLAVYMLAVRLFHALHLEPPFAWLVARFDFYDRPPMTAFGAFAAVVFSLVAGLPVFVLGWLGRRFGNEGAGTGAALAFVLCPAVCLVTMHMDQVLYPLCVSVCLAAAVLAVERHWAYAALLSVLVYASTYISFSLLFLAPAVLLLWTGYALRPDRRTAALKAGAAGAMGLFLCFALFLLLLNYHPGPAYRRAIAHHAAWRTVQRLTSIREVANFTQLAIWMGLPCALVCVRRWFASARGGIAQIEPFEFFTLLFPFLVLAVSIFGKTDEEIGRLWIPFMVPFFIVGGRELAALYGRRPYGFLASSLAFVVLVKNFHDFR